jgi:hypothetical protein
MCVGLNLGGMQKLIAAEWKEMGEEQKKVSSRVWFWPPVACRAGKLCFLCLCVVGRCTKTLRQRIRSGTLLK